MYMKKAPVRFATQDDFTTFLVKKHLPESTPLLQGNGFD